MGVKGIVEKIREKVREYKVKKELEELERIYTESVPVEKKKKDRTRGKNDQHRGWGELDEYFK